MSEGARLHNLFITKEIDMEVRKDTWLYRLWLFTFTFDDGPPRRTTPWRYRMRALFLPLPVVIVLAAFVVVWVVITVVGNWLTILSGSGVYVTWDDGESYLSEFDDIVIGDTEISSRVIAGVLWLCIAVGLLWYYYPDGFMMYGLMTVRVVIITAVIGAVSLWAIARADKAENDDHDRIVSLMVAAKKAGKPVPAEVVVFVDPPSKLDEEISGV